MPRLKLILLQNGAGVSATEYPLSTGGDIVGPSIFGHAGAPAAITVGAVQAGVTTQPEPYSSRGPVTHYFGPVSGKARRRRSCGRSPSRTSPPPTAAARPSSCRPKPPGVFRFCGTSAAAPHAAAVAALAGRRTRPLTPAQIGDRAGGDGEAGRRLRPERGRRRPDRRPSAARRRRPAAGGHDPSTRRTRSAGTARRASASLPTARCPSPARSTARDLCRAARPSPPSTRCRRHPRLRRQRRRPGRQSRGQQRPSPSPSTPSRRAPRSRASRGKTLRTRRRRAKAVFGFALQRAGLDLHLQDRRRPRPLLPGALVKALRGRSPRPAGDGGRRRRQRRQDAGRPSASR